MAEKQTVRLCYHIINAHFGFVTAQVASTLLIRGRLPLGQLTRLTPGVSSREVRLALLVLIQHNIVWHSEDEIDGEVYEINWEEPASRLRFGRYIMIVRDKLGDAAAEVLSFVLDNGKLKVGQVIENLAFEDPKHQKFLKPCTAKSHISPRDRLIQHEAQCKRERIKEGGNSILTPKDLMEIKMMAAKKIQQEEEEADALGMVVSQGSEEPRSTKKKNATEDEKVVNEDIFFKVNYPKLNTCIRNEIIIEAAVHRYNTQTAEVLRAALKATEDRQHNLLDFRSEPVGPHDISSKLSSTSVLLNGIRTTKKSYNPSVKDYIALLCNDDNHTPAGLASAFLAPVSGGGGGSGRVTVEFDRIGRRLKQRVYESNVRERFGDDAVKVIRILMDKGKMDEKHLSKVALIAPNVLRPLLTRLSAASLVSLQEVPKSADRNPSRTYYLWYVDLAKAYSNLLSALYQTLANIVARTAEEESQVRPSLDKRDRTDLSGQEHLLNRHDLAVLNEWGEKQERLHVLAMRVEENVFILRDMLGDPEPER
ncbi:RNA polymerase III subunit C82 [Tulasnella sp. 424]|nr:RNA polymerase III subunit C82 [Tulasnella sp. 424]KAG8972033.1 RNA polymerase III subunit C82 [Tulasnella sp. 425]